MPAYANLSGKSGVRAYNFREGQIEVTFRDGARYVYTYQSTGKARVDEMINRARAGWGLHRYINRSVGKAYAYRI